MINFIHQAVDKYNETNRKIKNKCKPCEGAWLTGA